MLVNGHDRRQSDRQLGEGRDKIGYVSYKKGIIRLCLWSVQIMLEKKNKFILCCLRPYHDEHTRSRLITEVKHRRAGIVLGWGTAWELPVP